MKTYQEVAEKVGLIGIIKTLYLIFMRTRWEKEEKKQCETGYADHWAMRFKNGMEYKCSDYEGRELLKELCELYDDEI